MVKAVAGMNERNNIISHAVQVMHTWSVSPFPNARMYSLRKSYKDRRLVLF